MKNFIGILFQNFYTGSFVVIWTTIMIWHAYRSISSKENKVSKEVYVIQDMKYEGADNVHWWAVGGGVTNDLSLARHFTEERATELTRFTAREKMVNLKDLTTYAIKTPEPTSA